LARNVAASDHSPAAAKPCLIGQPVALGNGPSPDAALRISASARLVSEAWSSDQETARCNLQRAIGDVGLTVANLEKLNSQFR
jgi:hypothetical protein